MSINTDVTIFKGKTLSNVFEDIYKNSKKKSVQVDKLITTLTDMVKNVNDAALVVPLVKEYLDIAIKNDDQLVKLAAIVQRVIAATKDTESGNVLLTDSEREQLYKLASENIKIIPLADPKIPTNDRPSN